MNHVVNFRLDYSNYFRMLTQIICAREQLNYKKWARFATVAIVAKKAVTSGRTRKQNKLNRVNRN